LSTIFHLALKEAAHTDNSPAHGVSSTVRLGFIVRPNIASSYIAAFSEMCVMHKSLE
jgi:hypothetical protein